MSIPAPGTHEPPAWVDLWHRVGVARGYLVPDDVLAAAVGSAPVDERFDDLDVPVVTGNSHTRLHAPSPSGDGACSPPLGSGERAAELHTFRGHREHCEKALCAPYFRALEIVGVVDESVEVPDAAKTDIEDDANSGASVIDQNLTDFVGEES